MLDVLDTLEMTLTEGALVTIVGLLLILVLAVLFRKPVVVDLTPTLEEAQDTIKQYTDLNAIQALITALEAREELLGADLSQYTDMQVRGTFIYCGNRLAATIQDVADQLHRMEVENAKTGGARSTLVANLRKQLEELMDRQVSLNEAFAAYESGPVDR